MSLAPVGVTLNLEHNNALLLTRIGTAESWCQKPGSISALKFQERWYSLAWSRPRVILGKLEVCCGLGAGVVSPWQRETRVRHRHQGSVLRSIFLRLWAFRPSLSCERVRSLADTCLLRPVFSYRLPRPYKATWKCSMWEALITPLEQGQPVLLCGFLDPLVTLPQTSTFLLSGTH